MATSNEKNLVKLGGVLNILQDIVANPDKYSIIELDMGVGTSMVPAVDGENGELQSVQKVSINIIYE